ncbi:hypothetical protein DFH09DRAFT_1184772 [Mycena vulgaris]|nr:hypothetical protein DFH09DRAFT_1184772 [Mycena vulgaris]
MFARRAVLRFAGLVPAAAARPVGVALGEVEEVLVLVPVAEAGDKGMVLLVVRGLESKRSKENLGGGACARGTEWV